jgi:aldehyde dehydrogenase (NAD+)
MTTLTASPLAAKILSDLGLTGVQPGAYAGRWIVGNAARLEVFSPGTGERIGQVAQVGAAEYETVLAAAQAAFLKLRDMPAPKRGELVRKLGNALREKKAELGALVSLEMGKILPEGLGEVQEAIDIADFAVGQSRMLYGLSMHSERPGHSMKEQWHPLGLVGIISAFNFPAAVWAWNSMLALICGDVSLWKPSPKAPLTAIAMTKVCAPVLEAEGLGAAFSLLIGSNEDIGERLVADRRVPLISFTGSTPVGRQVGQKVAARLGRSILELGGNNAIVVSDQADLDMVIRATLFGAVGTAGQRCTTTRRLLVHKKVYAEVEGRLVKAYGQVKVGNPLAGGTLCGPLIDRRSVEAMQQTLSQAKAQGARVIYGGEVLSLPGAEAGGHYVRPALVQARHDMPVVQHETFAPILYLIQVEDLDEALRLHNDVPQGLSSAIFTRDVREAERFLSAGGSDCGIANVNIGTSGAEIGGAFGGEKDTGGGRESGSDAWKAYMRRQTNTVNWSKDLPLAQGIQFG